MPTNHAPFSEVVSAVREHTSLLLGTTIGYSEEDWAAPTGLTGWTRSHVAAHLAQGATAMVRVIRGLEADQPVRLYESQSAKRRAIEIGALTSGLELQIQLDTTASELQFELASLEGDTRPVILRPGSQIAAGQLPLARLSEVVLHHMDLGSPFPADGMTPETAVSLLAFQVDLVGRRDDLPPIRLVSDEGFEGTVGRSGALTQMNGPARELFAWLTRGVESSLIYRSEDDD